MKNLTKSIEDYIEAIYMIEKEKFRHIGGDKQGVIFSLLIFLL